jgi:transcription antitermination factor NusG
MLSASIIQKKKTWYAVYTRPRHEKRIHSKLQQAGIEAFLPLRTTLRQWSDRKKKISEPLFSCYLFVYVSLGEYHKVLNVPGVVRYISFEGKAVPIADNQIQLIRKLLEFDIEATIDLASRLPAGTRVEITAGPLMGIAGELVDYTGRKRVIIRIEEISKSILVNVSLNYLKLVA